MLAPNRSAAIRSLTLLGLCSWLVGCASWRPMEEPYAETIAETHPSAIRVTLDDASRREVNRPVVSGDTIYDSNIRASYPLDRVQSVEVGSTSALATVGLVLGLTLLVLTVAAGVACADDPWC